LCCLTRSGSATAGWAKTVSNEPGPHGITIYKILTGNFNTQGIEKLIAEQAALKGTSMVEVREQRTLAIPTKRFGQPEEFGSLVSFLASDFAS